MRDRGSFSVSPTGAVAPEAVLADVVRTAVARRRRLGVGLWLPLGWIVLVAVVALAAPVLPLKHPTRNLDFARIASGPSGAHWLGTDELGRDILSRMVWGARVSLTVRVVSVAFGML